MSASDFRADDIGYLTQPVRIAEWIDIVRKRYAVLVEVDPEKVKILTCNALDLRVVETELAKFAR